MHPVLDRRRTIWVVDDSATDAERVRRLLVAEHHEVEVLQDGASALERLAAGAAPDLLLLDWIMPGISGIEVCKYLRSAPGKISQVPVLLLTARHGTQEITEAFGSGANDYVSKPFVNEELKARVDALLGAKRLVERAEQAEADVRALLANAPDPIFAVDAQGRLSFVNDEVLRVLDLPREQVVGRPFTELLPGMSLKNIGMGNGESFLPIPDVQIRDLVFSPSIRALPSDSAATTTVVLRDVTSRRQADARRLDFYSVIAHDLRTPITSILLRLQLASRGKHGVLPTAHLAELHKTESSLRSLAGMINDFLDLARLEGIGNKIDLQPVHIGQLIRTTVEDFEPLMEKDQHTWIPVGLDAAEIVMGDPRRICQVLANLLGNAIKFTAPGGKITTRVVVTKEYIETSIEDTGRGIPKDEIPKLFERFTRVREATTETSGTGLGLMIVREIVEAHGGIIGVDSKVGQGSRFWFRLPRLRSEPT